jgi:hypothetical protein
VKYSQAGGAEAAGAAAALARALGAEGALRPGAPATTVGPDQVTESYYVSQPCELKFTLLFC